MQSVLSINGHFRTLFLYAYFKGFLSFSGRFRTLFFARPARVALRALVCGYKLDVLRDIADRSGVAAYKAIVCQPNQCPGAVVVAISADNFRAVRQRPGVGLPMSLRGLRFFSMRFDGARRTRAGRWCVVS